MNLSGVVWILLSALMHATWNLLFKRAGGASSFMGLSKIIEVVLLTPVFLVFASLVHVTWWTYLWLSVGGAVFTVAGYVLLSDAYAIGDLAFVYPVARGSILCFLPILGAFFLHEHIDRIGALALGCLILGIVVMQLPSLSMKALRDLVQHLRTRATLLALGYGVVTAGSVLWDKYAIQTLPRLTYYYGYTLFVAVSLTYAGFFTKTAEATTIRQTFRAHGGAATVVSILNIASYMLILVALKNATSSYVVGLRQLSIGIGAFMGYYLLSEPMSRARVAGIALLLVGCVLIPLAR